MEPQPLERAATAFKAGRLNEAEGICRDQLESNPNNAAALAVLGIISTHRRLFPEAAAFYERALALVPHNDEWLANLAELHRVTFRAEDALDAARRALHLGLRTTQKHICISRILHDLGRFEEATHELLAATALDPQHAAAHFLLAQSLLIQGDFRPGWTEFEWRNRMGAPSLVPGGFKAPLWNGMRVPGFRILLIGDQGYGDTIQFTRYVSLVAERCREVVLLCSPPLTGLLSRIVGVSHCYEKWSDVPEFGAYALLSSLPFIFNTDAESIPCADKPYLSVDPHKAANYAERLSSAGTGQGPRVGLCWSGRPTHGNDARRSIALAALAPLATVTGVRYLSLQTDVRPADANSLALFPHLLDFSCNLADFDETAALVTHLDLVVTVDTAVAHLAGALGKPVWMMTPSPPDWRWQANRNDSPWYPTVRLFRQPQPGAWAPVVEAIRAEVEALRANRV